MGYGFRDSVDPWDRCFDDQILGSQINREREETDLTFEGIEALPPRPLFRDQHHIKVRIMTQSCHRI